MIGSFRSKSLRLVWEKNDPSGVNPNVLPRIRRILSILDSAESVRDLDVPGFRFHALKGFDPRRYAMRVTGTRSIFRRSVGGTPLKMRPAKFPEHDPNPSDSVMLWRITFAFEAGVAEAVEWEDYHGS